MNDAARHRAARQRLSLDLAHALGNVPPDIAESALGRTLLAGALIDEAVALLLHDADWPEARALAAALVASTGPPTQSGAHGREPPKR
jgi:hypothetical protein